MNGGSFIYRLDTLPWRAMGAADVSVTSLMVSLAFAMPLAPDLRS